MRRYKGEIFSAPPIITEELFNECNRIRETKTHRNYLTKYTYLLKDIAICETCGRNYFAKYKPVHGGDKVYVCSSRLIKKGNCGNVGVNIILLESAIFSEIFMSELFLKYLRNSSKLLEKLNNEIQQLLLKLKLEEKALVEAKESFIRLEDLYITTGGISKERYLVRKQNIESQVNNGIQQIARIKLLLLEKTDSLEKFNSIESSQEILIEAKSKRTELQAIYRQFISKVILESYEGDKVIASVYMQINGVLLEYPLILLLDLHGIRKQPITYRYKSIFSDYTPNEDGDMFELSDFDYKDWITIPKNNIIEIGI